MQNQREYSPQIQQSIIAMNQGIQKSNLINPDGSLNSKEQIQKGLEEIENGIATIELQSASFDSDPWLFDWLTVMKERGKIMRAAFDDFFGSLEKLD